jgi:hypothetical protein
MIIKYILKIMYGKTAYNKRLALTALFGRFGFRKARSVASLAPTPCSTTFLRLLELLRNSFIATAKTSPT